MGKQNMQDDSYPPELHPLAEFLANDLADKMSVNQSLLFARDAFVQQKTEEISQELLEHFQETQATFQKATDLLEQAVLTSSIEDLAVQEFSSKKRTFLTDLEKFSKTIDLQTHTIQELLGLSDNTILWMYEVASGLLQEKKLEEASSIFHLIVRLNPLVCEYWISFGLTLLQRQKTTKALDAFTAAILLDPEHPTPRYHSAKLYLQLGQKDDALLELSALEEIIQSKELSRLESLSEELKSEINKGVSS